MLAYHTRVSHATVILFPFRNDTTIINRDLLEIGELPGIALNLVMPQASLYSTDDFTNWYLKDIMQFADTEYIY